MMRLKMRLKREIKQKKNSIKGFFFICFNENGGDEGEEQ